MIKIKKLPKTFYPVNIYVVVADNWATVNDRFNSHIDEDCGACVLPVTESELYLVFRTDFFKLHFIIHELVHVVNRVYKYCDIEPDVSNDEHQAYFMDWLFLEVYKVLQKEEVVK